MKRLVSLVVLILVINLPVLAENIRESYSLKEADFVELSKIAKYNGVDVVITKVTPSYDNGTIYDFDLIGSVFHLEQVNSKYSSNKIKMKREANKLKQQYYRDQKYSNVNPSPVFD